MIGGNMNLALQVKSTTQNEICESVESWETVQTLFGWLDYSGGEAERMTYDTKIMQSTHFFIGDYVKINPRITEETARAVANGETYEIKKIDDPMGKHRQIEIFLKYTGAQV